MGTKIKDLGHYEGTVETIDVSSLTFKTLDNRHKNLIKLNNRKEEINKELERINEQINKIKLEIESEVKSGSIKWAWIWFKKSTNVKWKQEFIRFLGKEKANEVSNEYKQKSYLQIGIKFVDPIPESIKQIKSNLSEFPSVKHKLKSILTK